MRNRQSSDESSQRSSQKDPQEAEAERRIAAIPAHLDVRQRMAAIHEADPRVDPDMLLICFYALGELPGEDQIAFERRLWTDRAFRDRYDFMEKWYFGSGRGDGSEPPKRMASSAHGHTVRGRRRSHGEIAALMHISLAAVGWHLCSGCQQIERVMRIYESGEELPAEIAAELRRQRALEK